MRTHGLAGILRECVFGAGGLDPVLSGAVVVHLAIVKLRSNGTLEHIGEDNARMVMEGRPRARSNSTTTAVTLRPGSFGSACEVTGISRTPLDLSTARA
jgi:hypothetical protein